MSQQTMCPLCGNLFTPKQKSQIYCCRKCKIKHQNQVARAKPQYKTKRKKYDAKYDKSPKGKASARRKHKRYFNTPNGREAKRRADRKYGQSPHGREKRRQALRRFKDKKKEKVDLPRKETPQNESE